MAVTYRAAEVLVHYPEGHEHHCVLCAKRHRDSAGARAIANGMRVLCGASMLDRAIGALAAQAVCRGMRRVCREELGI